MLFRNSFCRVIFAMACFVVGSVNAQEKLSFKCTFGPGSAANWDTGKVEIERGNFGNPSAVIQFDAIDLEKGTARMIGNAGAADLAVMSSGAGVTLIEATRSGNYSFITIFVNRKPGAKELLAVMSRHITSSSGPFPSQYYGSCVPW